MRQLVVGITGASGAPYALRLLQQLAKADVHAHVVITPYGRQVLAEETDVRQPTVENLAGVADAPLTIYSHLDLGARISSGSFQTDGMVICPCSSNTLSAVASGLADNLVTRAAMVTLKEARRLVLVPRETPLHQIELENMLRLSRAGAVLCPASPGFYHRPQRVDDLINFVVARVLDLLQIRHELPVRWDPDRAVTPPPDQGTSEPGRR